MSTIKLIGSAASPYVRRIRIELAHRDYEFIKVNVFDPEGKKLLSNYSPTQRVPILIDDETVIWDSLLIHEYLSDSALNLKTKKELILINEMSDSGIQLFQLRKFDLDPEDSGTFSKNNLQRIENVLDFFDKRDLSEWNVVTMWLYCTLDWFDFRNVYDWREEHENLSDFYKSSENKPLIQETSPRI